jgi:murein tripeptide amidase MpaA
MPTPSPSASPSATARPWTSRQVIGHSVEERPIEAVRVGLGPRRFVIIGAIHGGVECNTHALVELLVQWFSQEPDAVPSDVTLFFVPALNPDGCALGTRFNARGVDLNRNWDTEDWTRDAEWSLVRCGSAEKAVSEPETNLAELAIGTREAHSGLVTSFLSRGRSADRPRPTWLQ